MIERQAFRISEITEMYSISRATIYREHSRGRISFVKVAGCVLIEKKEWFRYWRERQEATEYKLFVSGRLTTSCIVK